MLEYTASEKERKEKKGKEKSKNKQSVNRFRAYIKKFKMIPEIICFLTILKLQKSFTEDNFKSTELRIEEEGEG